MILSNNEISNVNIVDYVNDKNEEHDHIEHDETIN